LEPEIILKEYWGYDSFRPLQKDIINAVLAGRDTLCLMPTGGGKSLCYQVPALMQDGLCLVVSPLIALMKDQVARLHSHDIPAMAIHSGMSYSAVDRALNEAVQGAYKLLYVSPERLNTHLFSSYLPNMQLNLIAVDEAHCVSQWGHDFRPDYLNIHTLREEFTDVPVLALTATATPFVQQDIAAQLRLRDAALFRQSFKRQNIFCEVRYSENKPAEAIGATGKGCCIVYTRSRRQAEVTAKHLTDGGINATAYHAGMTKETREQAQDEWMNNETPVMVATTAFGMGIDKPDVRLVLHYDVPEHPEAYYQEAGRAGRDGQPSKAIMLYNTTDVKRLQDSIALHYPPVQYLREVYQAVVEYLQLPIGAEPDKYFPFDLHDFCKKFSLQPATAIHALKLLEREGLWTMSEAVYHPSTIQFTADRYVLDGLAQAHPTLSYVSTGLLRMYSTIFHYPTSVRESAICRQLKMKREELAHALAQLHHMGILEYNKPGEGPQLFFHHYRVDSRYLSIDTDRIARLKKRHEERTAAIIAFIENTTTCRERMLLEYFGESTTTDCGHCDVCVGKRGILIDHKAIQHEMLAMLAARGPVHPRQLAALMPHYPSQQVMEALRGLADIQRVTINETGLVIASRP
jgi:ATP-dependent DNA helicase RecQ